MIVRPVLCRPFIGRREELVYLNERRLEAASSHGALVLIGGDAGVGKSRLISEFEASLVNSRWRVGHGACDESANRPYGPILDALSRLDAGALELGAAATKTEQLDAIVERIASLAARRATTIVIEDLHWADAATLDLLAHFGTKLQRMRVLVLASFRAGELHPAHPAAAGVESVARSTRAGRIDLAPLTGSELQTFIQEALAGITLPPETLRAIALAGEGNPFFTEELLKNAVEAKLAALPDGKSRTLSPTVRATLLERLHPFDERERRVVTQAAVIGRTFSLALLATTLDVEPSSLLPVLRRARDFQLVEEVMPGVFRFRHGLTREAIYGDFLGAELRPRHRSIAMALEGAPAADRSLEALAYHWWAAGDHENTVRYNELAGDEAVRVHAHENAIAFYERALDTHEIDAVARGSIVEKIAARRFALGWTSEAHAAYTEAAQTFRDAGAHEREASCRVFAALCAHSAGLPNPMAALESMLARLGSDEYLARSRVHLGLAWLTATFWLPTQAAGHLAHVDARARIEHSDIELRYRNVAAWVAMTVGDIEAFRREHAAWMDAARATGSVNAIAASLYNGAMCFSCFGLHEDALELIERAIAFSRQARFRHGEDAAQAIAAMTHLLRGDLERARAALEAIPANSESRFNINFGTAWGTIVAAHLDDRHLIDKWFDGFEVSIASAPDIEPGAGFAEIMIRRGRPAEAAALLHRAIPDCEVVRGNIFTLLATARYGAKSDRLRAREYLVRGSGGANEMPERPALGLFDAYERVREGLTEDARALASDAAAGFRRFRMPLLEAAALEVAGDAAGALFLYGRCGALYDVRRLESDASHPSQSDALTAREREVALLAAAGHANNEIARALSITPKTIEKHLASVYRKLEITSRAKLGSHFAVYAESQK